MNQLTPEQQQILHDYSESCRVRCLMGHDHDGQVSHFALTQPAAYIENVSRSALRGIKSGNDSWERITEVARRHQGGLPLKAPPHPDTARLDFLLRFIRIDDVGDGECSIKGIMIKCEEMSDAIGFGPIKDNDADRLIKEWDDDLRTVIDRAIAAHRFGNKEASE